jgi:anaerobic ribonucleoside-triphosphate reductase activating protein
MNYMGNSVVLTEIPDEITLAVWFTGCPVHCGNCHSKELWDASAGDIMTENLMTSMLVNYRDKCSCFCAMGGEWEPDTLIHYLKIARSMGYLTALYTGEPFVSDRLAGVLDYLKINPYVELFGDLTKRTTNQIMYRLENGNLHNITNRFWKEP